MLLLPRMNSLTRPNLFRYLLAGGLFLATSLAPLAEVDAQAIRQNPGFTANTLPRNDDGSTGAVPIGFTINFFGLVQSTLFVNNNGNVTFSGPLSEFTPFPIQTTATQIIAPFFADVDTSNLASGVVQYGSDTIGGRAAFGVNWFNVGYYSSAADRLNTFQLVLIDRSDTGAGNFDFEFNYSSIQWETGNASGGVGGLGGSSARAGYSNGSTNSFELQGSAVNGAFLNGGPHALISQSIGTTVVGRDLFQVRNGAVQSPVITSPLTAAGTAGQQFTYQFLASGATSLSVSSLPAGLTFDPARAAIVGTPAVTGTFDVRLSATNSVGTTTVTLTLTVQSPPPAGPVLISGTSATGRPGLFFTFQVITTGGTPAARVSASGLPAGLSINAMSGLISGTPAAEGSSAVTLTVTDGAFTTSGIVELTFSANPALPVIISSNSASLTPGQFFSYTINAPSSADPSDPTVFTLNGNLPPGLGFDAAAGIISGTFNPNSGRIDLSGGVITNVQLFACNSQGCATIPLNFFLTPVGPVNISTRLAVDIDDNVLIGGFIITGNAPKTVIIRAIGPELTGQGVPGALQDTILELHDGPVLLGENDNWRDSQESEIIATGVQPTDDRESALIATLNPGGYTAIVRGKNGTTGVGLVEVYDLGTASMDNGSHSKLANISTRGRVLAGDDVMIGGFIISGQQSRVIVRAIGPELTGQGVPGALQDTTLELHDGTGALIASNDDWRSTQEQQIIDSTVPPTDNRESAIVANLTPGNYTAQVRGKNGTTGIGLVEVYVLP